MMTRENLQAAFAGESQANRRYTAFALKAEAEGLPQIAKLFRAAAAAETVHALKHLGVLGGVRDTTTNLREALAGELYEAREMYPKFLAEAEQEGNKPAMQTFQYALAVEKIHADLYARAAALKKPDKPLQDLPAAKIFVCSVCGNTVLAAAPDKCPICGVGRDKFSEVN